MVILENLDQGRRILLFSNAIFPLLSHNWRKRFPLWEFIGDFDCIFLSVHYKTEYASLTTNIIQYNTNLIEKSPHVLQVTRAKTNRCSIKKGGRSLRCLPKPTNITVTWTLKAPLNGHVKPWAKGGGGGGGGLPRKAAVCF